MILNKKNFEIVKQVNLNPWETKPEYDLNTLAISPTGTLATNGYYAIEISPLSKTGNEIERISISKDEARQIADVITDDGIDPSLLDLHKVNTRLLNSKNLRSDKAPIAEVHLSATYLAPVLEALIKFHEGCEREPDYCTLKFYGLNKPVLLESVHHETGQMFRAFIMPANPDRPKMVQVADKPVDTPDPLADLGF